MCALLALPASAFAQTPRSPTIFSPASQSGTINVRAAVVLTDYSLKPLPLLRIVARSTDRPDSISAQTDLDGRVTMTLRVGTYTLRAKTAQPVAGNSYAWSVRVNVRPSKAELVQLTNANASADSVATMTTVAAAAPVAAAPVAAAPVTAVKAAPPPATPPSPFAPPTQPVTQAPARAPVQIPKPAPTPLPVVRAQPLEPRANTSRLLLGLSFDASSIKSDDLSASTESGAGLAAQVGWGFTKNFALVMDASAARISSLNGDFDLAHVDIGGRWHFVSMRSSFVPFVEVGYSGRAATGQTAMMTDGAGNTYIGDLSILGSGVSLGGGFQYFLARTWAIGGALKWTTGQFSRVQFDNVSVDGLAIDATSARFNMGFTWFPMGR